jgi:arylsulfatase A-like enzyme
MKNIILITIDCLRPDHLNCYGYKKLTSPFISSLAQKGLMFTQMFSNSSYTCASIASMITSTYPFDYGEYFEYSTPVTLSRRRILLSEILKQNGYSTSFLHDNPYLSSAFGYNRGFDYIVDFGRKGPSSSKIKDHIFPTIKNKKVRRKLWKTKDLLLFLGWYFKDTPLNADAEKHFSKAAKWVQKVNSPFFLWIHLMDAHTPYSTRHQILNQLGINKFNAFRVILKYFNRKKLSDNEFNFFQFLYDVQIYQIDRALQQFFPKIVRDKESCIIITADHGENLTDRKTAGKHSGKLTRELLHVPLIIYGHELKPKIYDEKRSLIDLAPTILDLLNIPNPNSYKGTSLLEKSKTSKVIAQGIFKGKRYQKCV